MTLRANLIGNPDCLPLKGGRGLRQFVDLEQDGAGVLGVRRTPDSLPDRGRPGLNVVDRRRMLTEKGRTLSAHASGCAATLHA